MVEVFKTNIDKPKKVKLAMKKLNDKFPLLKVNYDLEDCDNILRVENPFGEIDNNLIIDTVAEIGFFIEILADTPLRSQPKG